MTEQNDLFEIIGDSSNYKPEIIPEVEVKEMIGKFNGRITIAELVTGEKNDKKWAKVALRIECIDEGLVGRLAFINSFLGAEPSMYTKSGKSQTEDFLDLMETAGLLFKDTTPQGFEASVKDLVGQECRFKSRHKKKKDQDTGKYVPLFNDAGYKVLAQDLIAKDKTENTTAAEGWGDV